MLRIVLASIFVEDQAEALAFYTDVLGFLKKEDIPMGEARWLTVVSPADPDGVELLLEPNDNAVARAYQEGLKAQGIPVTSFGVDDIAAEHERLTGLGVEFVQPPLQMGPVTTAMFDDTCGNLVAIAQRH